MKKVIAILISALSILFVFASCGENGDMNNNGTTNALTTKQNDKDDDMFDKENGMVSSTNQDSALGRGITDAVKGAERLDDDIKQDMEDAKNNLKNSVNR